MCDLKAHLDRKKKEESSVLCFHPRFLPSVTGTAMLKKQNSTESDQTSQSRCFGQKRFKFLSKMTRTGASSPYERMDDDAKEVRKRKKAAKKLEKECKADNKENKDVKDKKAKKKKTWKLVRQATLATCRYIGMGVAHMSPAAAYGSPDYYIDPKQWNKSFNTSCKTKPPPVEPHWTNTMMFSSW